MNSALIAFGSNIGDRFKFLQKSLDLMSSNDLYVIKYAPPITTIAEGMNDYS